MSNYNIFYPIKKRMEQSNKASRNVNHHQIRTNIIKSIAKANQTPIIPKIRWHNSEDLNHFRNYLLLISYNWCVRTFENYLEENISNNLFLMFCFFMEILWLTYKTVSFPVAPSLLYCSLIDGDLHKYGNKVFSQMKLIIMQYLLMMNFVNCESSKF